MSHRFDLQQQIAIPIKTHSANVHPPNTPNQYEWVSLIRSFFPKRDSMDGMLVDESIAEDTLYNGPIVGFVVV